MVWCSLLFVVRVLLFLVSYSSFVVCCLCVVRCLLLVMCGSLLLLGVFCWFKVLVFGVLCVVLCV